MIEVTTAPWNDTTSDPGGGGGGGNESGGLSGGMYIKPGQLDKIPGRSFCAIDLV